MSSISRRSAAAALAAGLCALGPAAVAQATPTATLSGGALTVTGDNTDEQIAAADVPGNSSAVDITSAGINDADGPGSQCTVSGNVLRCTSVTSVALNGGGGNDTLSSTRSATGYFWYAPTTFDGGPGNDVESGGPGADRFVGEPGADTYSGGSRSQDPAVEPYKSYLLSGQDPDLFQMSWEAGAADTLVYDASSTTNLSVTQDGQANDGAAGEGDNVGADIEAISTGKGNDTLVAGPNAVQFSGGPGDDTLTGGPGPDTLLGGGGSDTMSGGGGDDGLYDGDDQPYMLPLPTDPAAPPAGVDKLDGGPGNDYFGIDLGADDVVGGDGVDQVSESRYTPLNSDGTGTRTPIDMAISLDDQANDGAAGEGDNIHSDVEDVSTGAGNDTIVGSAAANQIWAGAGKDTITPGGGADFVDAGLGDDTINAQDGEADRVDGGKGNDTANVDLAGGQPDRADSVFNVETVAGVALPALNPPPPAPNTPPGLTILTNKVKAAGFLKRGVIAVNISSTEPVTAVGDALVPGKLRSVGDLTIGEGHLPLGTGARTLKIKISGSQLKGLKKALRTKAQRRSGIRVKIVVSVTDTGGLTTTQFKRVAIKG